MTGNHQELEVGGRTYRERKLISRWRMEDPLYTTQCMSTRMTLAVLHDSGWYNVDFSLASPGYSWGRGLGCGFLETSCLQFSRGRADPGPYCDQPSNTPKQPRCLHW